jgi:hypothetical protein
VQLIFFSSLGWESRDVRAKPAIPDGIPFLIDDDLVFVEPGVVRATVVVNRWLRELPTSGAPAPGTWAVCARVLRDWMMFCAVHGIEVLSDREGGSRGVRGASGRWPAAGPVRREHVEPAYERVVVVLSMGCGSAEVR